MNKIFLIFLLLLFIPSSNAITFLNDSDSNTTTYINSSYSSSGFIDNIYYLNSSDVFNEIYLDYLVHTYPKTIIFNFYDSSNNRLTIVNTLTKNNKIIGYDITRNYKVYYNLVQLNFTKSFSKQDTFINEINESTYFIFGTYDYYGSLGVILKFNGINCCEKNIVGKVNTLSANFPVIYNYIPNRVILTNESSYLKYLKITIKYVDNQLSLYEFSIDEKVKNLNFVFQFIFLIGKGLLSVGSFLGGASLSDFKEYQKSVLFPLEVLNTIIDYIFMILGFIWNVGIVISIIFIIMITFIFSMITSKDIYEGIGKFFNNLVSIFSLLIKPITWIFEKIVKFWS